MKISRQLLLLIAILWIPGPLLASECVILLHGLLRTSSSMLELESALNDTGFHVVNIDYPSRQKPIEELAPLAIDAGLSLCHEAKTTAVNFVTHSLGGILVRQYYQLHDPAKIHRVVMLGPPNQGSEVVDKLRDLPGFELLNGPAGLQLGTDDASIPKNLGPVNFELGVIAGTESINLLTMAFMPDPNDGAVTLQNTQVEGMCSFIALPTTHVFMMKNDEVIKQVIHFLQNGRFIDEATDKAECKS